MLTRFCRHEHAGWWTHSDAINFYGAVGPVRNALLVAEHYPGQQQHHRQHHRLSDANLGTLQRYCKVVETTGLLGSEYSVQYREVERTQYRNTTFS